MYLPDVIKSRLNLVLIGVDLGQLQVDQQPQLMHAAARMGEEQEANRLTTEPHVTTTHRLLGTNLQITNRCML